MLKHAGVLWEPLRTGGACQRSHQVIAGVDEVGRGALFGPVVAAAVILPEGIAAFQGLRDSKQLLPEATRAVIAHCRTQSARHRDCQEVDAETIDRINIYQATKMAMTAAVMGLSMQAGSPFDRCVAAGCDVRANQHHLRRLPEHFDCRRIGGGQGLSRPGACANWIATIPSTVSPRIRVTALRNTNRRLLPTAPVRCTAGVFARWRKTACPGTNLPLRLMCITAQPRR